MDDRGIAHVEGMGVGGYIHRMGRKGSSFSTGKPSDHCWDRLDRIARLETSPKPHRRPSYIRSDYRGSGYQRMEGRHEAGIEGCTIILLLSAH